MFPALHVAPILETFNLGLRFFTPQRRRKLLEKKLIRFRSMTTLLWPISERVRISPRSARRSKTGSRRAYTQYDLIRTLCGGDPLVYWERARQVVRPIAVRTRTPTDLFIIIFRAFLRNEMIITSETRGIPLAPHNSYLEDCKRSKELKFS